ncbi:hypothetical protein IFM89_022267 [Coptis chinensis]|uniref:Uncharacterized protein n=1 Tax=Coptis chinensis TaxID=261450 RepID=A0A835HEY2_9MAGN|nr:hypothetical protein IFM89_022267 [Coptis chinensis]
MATPLITPPSLINTTKYTYAKNSLKSPFTPPRSIISLKHSYAPFAKRNRITVLTASSNPPGNASTLISEDTQSLLNKVNVFDLNGNATVISDLWKDRKALVAFARHFGCVLCRKRADYLASVKDKMDAAGVTLILIGPGSIDQAKAFAEQTKFKGGIIADVGLDSLEPSVCRKCNAFGHADAKCNKNKKKVWKSKGPASKTAAVPCANVEKTNADRGQTSTRININGLEIGEYTEAVPSDNREKTILANAIEMDIEVYKAA